MDIIKESFQRLFPQQEFYYQTELKYNRRLGSFNANISVTLNKIKVNLNWQWKDIDDEIKIGLLQQLLLRILKSKDKSNTVNIELYNNFIKQIPVLVRKTRGDPLLIASFERINRQFLDSSIERPNMQWGQPAFRQLAHYNFHDDTITISSVFKDAPLSVLDYLMYHELLHKSFKFNHNHGRSLFHSPEFRKAERAYPNFQQVNQEITRLVLSKKGQLKKTVKWFKLW